MDNLLAHLLLQAVGQCGSYDPDECLIYVEESMTGKEFKEAEAFLTWVHANGKEFGHGNILQVYAEFKAA